MKNVIAVWDTLRPSKIFRARGAKRVRKGSRCHLQVERLEALRLMATTNIPVTVLPAPASQTLGNVVTSFSPIYVIYNTANRTYQTAETITTSTTVPGSLLPIINSSVDYHSYELGYPGDTNIPVSVLPGPPSTTNGGPGTTTGPIFTIYGAKSHTYQTAQPVFVKTADGVVNTTVNYTTVPLGYSGNNIPVNVLPAPSPSIVGNKLTSAGPLFTIYNATDHTFQSAQSITTTTQFGGSQTQIQYSRVPVGYADGNIPVTVLPAPPSQTTGGTFTQFGPIFVLYNKINRTYQTGEQVTTSALTGSLLPPVTSTSVAYTSVTLGYPGGDNVPVTVLPGQASQTIGNRFLSFGPLFTIYDKKSQTYQTAQTVTTSTSSGSLAPPTTTSTVNYATIALGVAGHDNVPVIVLPPSAPSSSGGVVSTFGPLFTLYDRTNQTYLSAQSVTMTSSSGTSTQVERISTQVGYVANNIPVTVLPPPPPQTIAGVSFTYGPIFAIYDATALTYQTATNVTLRSASGIQKRVDYTKVALGY
jgi:hypothetical protein